MRTWEKQAAVFITMAAFLFSGAGLHAQCPDKPVRPVAKSAGVDSEILEVNQVGCWFHNDGIFASDPSGQSGFYYPSGQRELSMIYMAGPWVIGKVPGEDLRSAACQYSSEFQPGMILPDGTADDPSLDKYQVYKYAKGDAVDPDAIEQGCPSEVIGDQMLFCVFNDMASHGHVWQKPPIGLEVRLTAFAFDRPGALGNTVFIRYHFTNKGKLDLRDAYFALWMDPDLGQSNDDYAGCDPDLNMIYVYNGDGFDEQYGVQVPSLGCDFVQGPLVPAPGKTAKLPDGTLYENMKLLPMTAAFFFI